MNAERLALRTVPARRRSLALAMAFSGFLAISFLGVKDLASTAPVDARGALAQGAVSAFVAVVYGAVSAGGEVARGGLALALIGGDRLAAVRSRLAAYAAVGATLGLAGAATAAALTYVLLGIGGGPLPEIDTLASRAAGALAAGALLSVAGAALGLALRSAAAAVAAVLVVLLAIDPLLAGASDELARWVRAAPSRRSPAAARRTCRRRGRAGSRSRPTRRSSPRSPRSSRFVATFPNTLSAALVVHVPDDVPRHAHDASDQTHIHEITLHTE